MRYAQHWDEHAEHVGSGCCTCAGDEVDGVVAVLRILPELDVGVVEDVGVGLQVVEGLRRQDHAHVIPAIHQRDHLQEEVWVGNLHGQRWSVVSRGPVRSSC